MHFVFQEDEGQGSVAGSDKAEEEGEDLEEDEEEYDEEEEEDDDRPRKKPRHGGFILDEAGKTSSNLAPGSPNTLVYFVLTSRPCFCPAIRR